VSFLNRTGSGAALDVGAVFDASVWEYVCSIVQHGALVSLGRTRDGGALSVTVTVDGAYEREWCRSPEEAASFLREVDTFLSGQPVVPPSVKEPRRRR